MLIKENKTNFERSSLAAVKQAYAEISVQDFTADTVIEAIFNAADAYPEEAALIMVNDAKPDSEPLTINYRTLKQELIKAGNLLQSLGIKPGDPIAFLALPSYEGLIFFWAALSFAAVAPINPLLSADVIKEICDELQVKVLIAPPLVSEQHSEKVLSILKSADTIEHVISETVGEDISIPQVLHHTEKRCQFSAEHQPKKLPDSDDVAAYFHTGGTTGVPKVAKILNRNILSGVVQTHVPAGSNARQVTINGIPLFHVGGGVIISTGTICKGDTLVQLGPLGYRTPGITDSFWSLVNRYEVTQIIAVPTVYQDILRSYNGEKTPVVRFISSASKLPTTILQQIKDLFGLDVLEGYGMTECTGFCCSSINGLPVKPGATGIAVPNFTVRTAIISDNQVLRFCDENEVGNILVRGPGVFAGYTDPAKTAARFVQDPADGGTWLNSEDLGRLDEDGYLFVVGRSKDLIIRSGHNIDPATIEDSLLAYTGVQDAAAVGMPDQRAGELPMAFVVTEPGKPFDEQSAISWCRENIKEAGAVPVRIVELESLPRTAMNKIFKPSLKVEATRIGIQRLFSESAEVPEGIDLDVICSPSGQIIIEINGLNGTNRENNHQILQRLSVLGLEIKISE